MNPEPYDKQRDDEATELEEEKECETFEEYLSEAREEETSDS